MRPPVPTSNPCMPVISARRSDVAQTQTTRWLTRALRLLRLSAHLIRGLLIVQFIYPRRTHELRLVLMKRWSRQLLGILRVTPHLTSPSHAQAVGAPCMVVANHISWLDIFVINAYYPVRFVAKSEIRAWPLIGTLCSKTGTLFVERVRRRDAHRINEMIGRALAEGDRVAVFPEGTTTDGSVVQHFHANLLQSAIDRNTPLHPVALQYSTVNGSRCVAAGYVGEQTLMASMIAILAQPEIIAGIGFLAAVHPAGRSRRELARRTETAIVEALAVPLVHTQPVSPAGHSA